MDVVELDAASNNGVDNVRALRDEAIFSPAVVKKRVYIIDEVHMLSTQAFNALLKILEEPPEHLMFILATTELQKVPATILSRCQRHSFKRIDSGLIAEHLINISRREGFSIDTDAASLLARLSDGGMRDAISLLDQCSASEHIGTAEVLSAMGLSGNSRTARLLGMISRGESSDALELFAELWKDGKDPSALLGELSSLLRDILMFGLAPKKGLDLLSGGYDTETLSQLAQLFTKAQLLSHLNTIQASIADIRAGQTPRTAAELCIIGLCEPDLSDNTDNLRSRISVLEKKLANLGSVPVTYVAATSKKPIPDVGDLPDIHSAEEALSTPPVTDDMPPFDLYDASPVPNEEPPLPELPDIEEFYSVPTTTAGHSWSDIVAAVHDKVSVGEYNIISDNYHSDGEFDGSKLTIYAKNVFAARVLNSAQLQEKLRAAASALCGGAVTLSVTEGEAGKTAPGGSLDMLSRFGNVKFE